MATQVLDGTWEEITKHSKRLIGKQLRVTILDEESVRKSKPNARALAIIRKVKEKQKDMCETGGESSVDIIRRGRAKEMFGYERDE